MTAPREPWFDALRDDAAEWSVIYPNGVRVRCASATDALSVQEITSGRAQWRSGWCDMDVEQRSVTRAANSQSVPRP